MHAWLCTGLWLSWCSRWLTAAKICRPQQDWTLTCSEIRERETCPACLACRDMMVVVVQQVADCCKRLAHQAWMCVTGCAGLPLPCLLAVMLRLLLRLASAALLCTCTCLGVSLH